VLVAKSLTIQEKELGDEHRSGSFSGVVIGVTAEYGNFCTLGRDELEPNDKA
jgi:hypothetical protein